MEDKVGNPAEDEGEEEIQPSLKSRVFFFFLPVIFALIWIAGLIIFLPLVQAAYIIGGMAAYSFTPAGPEFVVPLVTKQVMEEGGDTFLHPALVATSMAFVDMVFAMFFMWNFDLLLKIPLIGPWMGKMERIGRRKLSDKPWVHRFALLGLVVYTMFPFQGSGGAVGSIFGRILGMGKRRVFVAITLGAFAGAFPFAYLTYYGSGLADELLTTEQKLIGAAIFFTVIIAGMIYLSREEDRLYGDKPGDDEGSGEPPDVSGADTGSKEVTDGKGPAGRKKRKKGGGREGKKRRHAGGKTKKPQKDTRGGNDDE